MSRLEDIGSWAILVCGAGLVTALLAHEWGGWRRARGDAERRPEARARLVRRATGGLLLLATVVLVRFPDATGWEPGWRLARLGVLLGLCLALTAMALWDFRIVRRELQRDVQGFVTHSAQELREYLAGVAKDDPQLAEKLRQILAGRGESSLSERSTAPLQGAPAREPNAAPRDPGRADAPPAAGQSAENSSARMQP